VSSVCCVHVRVCMCVWLCVCVCVPMHNSDRQPLHVRPKAFCDGPPSKSLVLSLPHPMRSLLVVNVLNIPQGALSGPTTCPQVPLDGAAGITACAGHHP